MSITDYLVGKGYTLKNTKMVCPFPWHNEHVASFTVYEDTDSFYCFGCNIGGNLARLMKLLGDPVPKSMVEKDIIVPILPKYTKKPNTKKLLRLVTRTRRMRRWYPNHRRLNDRLDKAVRCENTTYSGFTRKT